MDGDLLHLLRVAAGRVTENCVRVLVVCSKRSPLRRHLDAKEEEKNDERDGLVNY